jgi:hypothetical protein
MAQILEAPDRMTLISVQALERLAAMVPESSHAQVEDSRAGGNFDLDQWLGECTVPVVRSGPWNGGRKLILNPCPWNPEHTNGAAYIVQFANGAIAAGCHHNGCERTGMRCVRSMSRAGNRPERAEGQEGIASATWATRAVPEGELTEAFRPSANGKVALVRTDARGSGSAAALRSAGSTARV